MNLTFYTQYVARNGEVFGPLAYSVDLGFWTDGNGVWKDNGEYFIRDAPELDLLRVHTLPTPPAFATSA